LQVTVEDVQVISWQDGRVLARETYTEASQLPDPPLPFRPERVTRRDTLLKTPNGWQLFETVLDKLDYLDQ